MSSKGDSKDRQSEKELFVLHASQEQTAEAPLHGKEEEPRTQKKYRFHPTDKSLDIAEEIAAGLDMEMNRKKTAQWATELLELYYHDVAEALGDDICKEFTFEHLANRKLVAFSAHTSAGKALVSFDQQLDSWLFSLNILIGIRAFWSLPEDQYEQTAILTQGVLATLEDPYLHEKIRPYIKPYITGYVEALPVVNFLVMAMSAFIICHEIAHHTLGHVGMKNDPQHEYDADKIAYAYLEKVCNAFDQLTYLKVSENMMAAPCLLMKYFDLAEQWSAKQQQRDAPFSSESHPPSFKRYQSLEAAFSSRWSQEAVNLYDGFSGSLHELVVQLELNAR